MEEPRTPGQKFAVLFDTAKRCLIVLNSIFAELQQSLQSISESDDGSKQKPLAIKIYTGIFAFIDFSDRFLDIVDAMPLLSKRRLEVRTLYKEAAALGECRNYMQHIRNHLSKSASLKP